ncbi:MAG: N-acetylneuraminate lyase [Oscillospiraceae bacterium]|jgi:N-acetylneuraminate lyase|nr:N-acetylneuraminate lyase [Oscillospiraceae bacterium]
MNGIFSALVGAFDAANRPDPEAIRRVVRHNIEKMGIDGLYVCGSTGENFLLPPEYKKTILKEAAAAANGEVTMIAHIGCNVLEEVDELCGTAADAGYDAVSAVTPYYYKFSAEEIRAYYLRIADRSPLPLIIYNIPLLTSVALSREDFRILFDHKNIAGVKFTAQDFYLLERIRGLYPDKLIYSGFDETLLSAAVLGTNGAIGSTYNIIGNWAKALFKAVETGTLPMARALQGNINSVVDMLLAAGIYPTLKAVLALQGAPCGECRPPMGKTTDAHQMAAAQIDAFIRMANR